MEVLFVLVYQLYHFLVLQSYILHEVDFTQLPAGILVLKTEKGAIKIKN